MIYVDTSVAIAELLAESRVPPPGFWNGALVSSRLLEYEVWNRLHVRRASQVYLGDARSLLAGVQLIEMFETVLARALVAFPVPVRTLDGLHLATADFLRGRGEAIELASYDRRLIAAAQALAIPLFPL